MPKNEELKFPYPRRRLMRSFLRGVGRVILPIACRVELSGQENFPKHGPLLVVGNHIAVMEVVMMGVYTPWQIEMLGAADVPHERITTLTIGLYGTIPVNRGHFDRQALENALSVLEQGGIVGIFPEGGIWEPGEKPPQTGVAWLSHRANAPVLPMGFTGAVGALGDALHFKRPRLTMKVGEVLPPAKLVAGQPRKTSLRAYATQVMEAVNALLPPEMLARKHAIRDERFELDVVVHNAEANPVAHPADLHIAHGIALARLLHRPGVLKILRQNLRLPIAPLQTLHEVHDAHAIAEATESVLHYLKHGNPYLLTYRFGANVANAMHAGLEELMALARWAEASGFSLVVTPIRRYIRTKDGQEVVQTEQGAFDHWM